MTSVVISQPMYFPWVGLFEQMRLADVYVWLDDVQFSKGSFTNRVQVLLPDKQAWMTIPLADKTERDIRDLSAKGNGWKASHRDLLAQSLRKSGYLDNALGVFDEAVSHEQIVDILIASSETCARNLRAMPPQSYKSSDLGIEGRGSARVLDIVRCFGGTRYLTGHGAAKYLDMESFEAAGVAVEFMDYQVVPWPQRGDSFTPYVTALDLIAVKGANAPDHLSPRTIPWRDFVEKRAETS
jgi:WbqC-like protein family